MPQINIHQQEIGIRSTPSGPMAEDNITPKIADTTAVGEALFKTGAATSDFADALIKSKVLADTASAKLDYSTAMTEHLAEGKKLTNLDEIETHKEKSAKIKQSIEEKYPMVAGALRSYMDHGERIANVDLDNHIWKVAIDDIKAKNLAYVEDLNKKIAYSNPEQAEEYRIERDAYIDNIVEVGAMHPADGEKTKRVGNRDANLATIEAGARENPEVELERLLDVGEDGKSKSYPYLDAGELAKAVNHVDDRIRFNRDQFYKNENRAQHETLYKAYEMIENKDTPDSQKIAQIDQWLIPDAQGMRMMDPRTAYQMKNAIKNGEHHVTDFVTWQNLYLSGLPTPDSPTGTLTPERIRAAQFSGRLSTRDAMTLTQMITKQYGETMTKEEKALDADIKREIKGFSDKVKTVLGSDTASTTSKALAGTVIWDAVQTSDRIKKKEDFKWFKEYLDKSVDSAVLNNNKDYLEKMMKRDTEWYNANVGKTRESQRPAYSPSAGNSSAFDSLIDQTFGKDADTFRRIMKAESGNDPAAHNPKGGGTGAFGLFQIRGALHEKALKDAGIIASVNDLFDPATNVKAAKFLFDRDGTSPWNESKAKWNKGTTKVAKNDPLGIR